MSIESKIKAEFDDLGAEIKPSPKAWHRLEVAVGARQRRHVVSVFVLILVIVGGGVFAISRSPRPDGLIKPANPQAWARYSDERRWSWTYPRTWTLQQFRESSRIFWEGALMMNHDRVLVHPKIPNGYTNAWDFRGLPADTVIVQFQYFYGGVQAPDLHLPGSVFPLSLNDAKSFPTYEGRFPGLILPVTYHHDSHYELIVWMGPDVSPADMEIVRQIVASIRFSEPANTPIANPETLPSAPPFPDVGTR